MNVGDWLGPWLFEAISGAAPRHAVPDDRSLRAVHMTVGSIAHFIRADTVVWGSGVISRDSVFPRPRAVFAVRGPLTRRRFLELGHPCPEVYGDPAILLPRFISPDLVESHKLSIVPHYVDYDRVLARWGPRENVHIIDVCSPLETVVAEIASSAFVVSSSLHGLIIAQAFGVPAVWVRFSDGLYGDGVKFHDHYAAMGVAESPGPVDLTESTPDMDGLAEFADRAPTPHELPSVADRLLPACPFRGEGARIK